MHLPSLLFLIRHITLRKALNLLKVTCSYHMSIIVKKDYHRGFPFSLSVEPTNYCNLHCPECPSGNNTMKRHRGLMSMDIFYRSISQLSGYLFHLNLYFQGEPFINTEIYNMIAFANSKGIYTSTSTNLHCITEKNAARIIQSGLKHIIVSVDGMDEATYRAYRKGGSFAKAIEGLKNLVDAKKRQGTRFPLIEAQCLILKSTENNLQEIKGFLKSKGADTVAFKTAQFEHYETGNDLMPEKGKSRYRKKEDGLFYIKNNLPNKCWRMWSSSVITWNGTVVPCCFDKHSVFAMGNIKNEGFGTILHNEKYNKLRTSILINRKNIDICKNCTEGLKC